VVVHAFKTVIPLSRMIPSTHSGVPKADLLPLNDFLSSDPDSFGKIYQILVVKRQDRISSGTLNGSQKFRSLATTKLRAPSSALDSLGGRQFEALAIPYIRSNTPIIVIIGAFAFYQRHKIAGDNLIDSYFSQVGEAIEVQEVDL